jgi:large exoprotein involved in heme utilization and adhesion
LNKGAQLQTLVRGVSDDGALPGQGDAGEVNINVSERVTIDGVNNQGFPSAIFSTIGLGANGDAGGITINAKSLYLNDGGRISVDNFGSGGAGDIQLTLREDLRLQNQSSITAVTLSGEGGNMTLIVPDLLVLTRNSDISTTAGIAPGGGDGGKIQINTQYIFGIPVGDNNITAQAYLGNGGSIIIDAAQLYKIGPNSDDFLNTNDITVSSRYGRTGEYRGNVLNTDPNQALNNLPQTPVDASRLIAQRCAVRSPTSGEENKFTVTGTGGFQPNPNETLQNESVVTNWVTLDPKVDNSTVTPTSAQPNRSAPMATHPSKTPAYTEAQGWVINEKGEVILTAQAPTVTPHNPSLMPVAACNGS